MASKIDKALDHGAKRRARKALASAKRKGASLPSKGITPAKARKILHDGSVRGHPLTPKQRRMFGAATRGK